MNTLVMFVNILAVIFFVIESLMIALKMFSAMTYSDIDKALDGIKGYRRSWPIKKNVVIFIVCLAWLLAQWLT